MSELPKTVEARYWYFTSSLIMHTHPKYDELLSHVRASLEVISPGSLNTVIEAKGSYSNAGEWLSKWPQICQNTINGGLFFALDNAGYIGKGVFTEVTDVLKKGLPVYLVERSGRTFPVASLVGDFITYGSNWTMYAHVDIDRLTGKRTR